MYTNDPILVTSIVNHKYFAWVSEFYYLYPPSLSATFHPTYWFTIDSTTFKYNSPYMASIISVAHQGLGGWWYNIQLYTSFLQ